MYRNLSFVFAIRYGIVLTTQITSIIILQQGIILFYVML